MSPKTSNAVITSSTLAIKDNHRPPVEPKLYVSPSLDSNTTRSAVSEMPEMRTAHCMSGAPCPTINIELDIKKMEKRKYLSHLNQKMKNK